MTNRPNSLEFDEAVQNNHDHNQIFLRFIEEHLFDTTMPNEEFIEQMNRRLQNYEAASTHLIALLDEEIRS